MITTQNLTNSSEEMNLLNAIILLHSKASLGRLFQSEMMLGKTPGFRTLRLTRWTVRAGSLRSVLDNDLMLQAL